jgi:hypothetical protein
VADQRIVLEFIGDPRGLKPAVDVLKAVGSLTKEQIALIEKANAEFAKRSADIQKQTAEQQRLTQATGETGKSVEDLANKAKKLPEGVEKFGEKLGDVDKKVDSMIGSIKKIGAAIGIAFTIQQIGRFIAETVKLAAAGEGVRVAFKRIGSDKVLENMTKAVKGTVSEVELMKQAVRASNFGIPLTEMGDLFEFARRRAKETGESVDYLVNSIITGLGRKSPLILDNLQLTTKQLQAALGDTALEAASIGELTAAASAVAREELQKMGEEVTTTNDLIMQGGAAWDNFKERAGQAFIKVGIGLLYMAGQIEMVDPKVEGLRRAMLTLRQDWTVDLRDGTKSLTDLYKKTATQVEKVSKLEADRARINKELNDNAFTKNKQKLVDLREEGKLVDDQIRIEKGRLVVLQEVFRAEEARAKAANKGAKSQVVSINSLREEIKKLKEKFEETDSTSNDLVTTWAQLQAKTKQLNALLARFADENGAARGSLNALNEELKTLREKFEGAVVGTAKWFESAKAMEAKAKEIEDALLRIKIALEPDPGLTLMPVKSIKELNVALDTLKELNDELTKQKEIMTNAPEFSPEYRDAAIAVDDLTKRIKNFGLISEESATKSVTAAGVVGSSWKMTLDEIAAEFQMVASTAQTVYDSITSASKIATDIELRNLDNQLNAGLISRETADKKRREIMRRQAEQEKQAALFKAIINTAVAVATALTAGPISGQILAGITAALGAVEIGLIAAQPIPAFAKGTKDAPKGFKWVGEKGAELVYDDGGYPIITHAESKVLADRPYSTQAQSIMRKYDIPQMHTGLFNQSMQLSDKAREAAAHADRGFDYDRLADVLANKLMFQDGNLLRATDRLRISQKKGVEWMTGELVKHLKTPKRGGYA